jgi:hypothetical protein
VRRVEVDNLLQGLALDLGAEPWPLSGSIYTPYLAVSATRLCPLANCDSEGPVRIGVWPCKRQCRSYSLELRHPIMGGPLLVRGNEVLFEGPALPPEERLAEMGITRVVELARGDERGGGP